MKVKKFSDLAKVKHNMVVDLDNLNFKEQLMVVSFLSGLTYQRGSLTKIARHKYLIRLGD